MSQQQQQQQQHYARGPPLLPQYPQHPYAHAGPPPLTYAAQGQQLPYRHQHQLHQQSSDQQTASYSIVPQTRRRSTSPFDEGGSPEQQQQQRQRGRQQSQGGGGYEEEDASTAAAQGEGAESGGGSAPTSGHGTPEDPHAIGGVGKSAAGGGGKKASKKAKTSVAAAGTTNGPSPSAASGPQAPPLKRGNACNICRKRKLKCDGQRPVCGTCARLKHECQYGDPAQERIAARHRQLEERIQSLEAELAGYRNGTGGGESSSSSLPPLHPLPPPPGSGSSRTKAIPALAVPHHHPHQGRDTATSAAVDPSLYFTAAAILPPPPPPPASSGIKHEPSTPLQGSSTASAFPQYSTHELPVESPFIFPSPVLSDHAPSATSANGDSSGNNNTSGYATSGATDIHPGNYVPVPLPAPPPPHLQSFPFAMNPTPQLSDLVNPTNTGAAAGPPSASPTAPYLPYQQQQQAQYDANAALTPIYGTDLPPLEIMLDLADIYFSTLHLHLPFLHRRRFLYTVHNSASLAAAPSQSLVFAVLAIAAAYHDNPAIRAQAVYWYAKARERVDFAISANVHPLNGSRVATLTVEMVQALCLLALIEMGQSDHQRAFLSLGQAVRIAAMLGLTRMDEDRVADRTGQMVEKRLRPPALHPLPDDAVLLEECRRTMCAVYVLDRFESATVGWPSAIAETDVRVLLPCPDDQFENGRCERDGRNNPLWWPSDGAGTNPAQGWEGIRTELEAEGDRGGGGNTIKNGSSLPKMSTFAWLCRVVWLGSRIQCETYRASGPPPGGPWNRHVEMDPLDSPAETVEMDRVIEYIRSKLSDSVMTKAQLGGAIDGPEIMALLTLNCMITNLYHLRAASGLSQLPWDPSAPVSAIGSSEFAMQRCWQALHSQHEILSHLTQYENAHTSLHRSRLNTFTAFVPYILYTIAFPAKFAIGEWKFMVQARDRSENVPAHLARDDLPSGDDAFPPSYFERRLAVVDICCEAMDRVGEVWPVGRKFAAMVRGDRMRLAARTYSRSNSVVQPPSGNSSSPPDRRSSQNGYHQPPPPPPPQSNGGEY
ncbi:hypothetical protein JCM10908_006308 [Rhodotorula pacifica]|uniref:Zn(II)2Cys6 transcription factor n=1 Tax=Rhodotorula pacifica TaxID=1495444 RepID=UPI00317601D5